MDAWVHLYWIPLGAGDTTGLVKRSGRAYERLVAMRQHRQPRGLFHSALQVALGDSSWAIEVAPAWGPGSAGEGVVGEGPVGAPWLGRLRLFRYEVRCRRGGQIPDAAFAVGGAHPVQSDPDRAARLLGLTEDFPCATWGRDELGTGEMWNSNSLVSWLLATSGHDTDGLGPPAGGRAPGWRAGIVAVRAAALAR